MRLCYKSVMPGKSKKPKGKRSIGAAFSKMKRGGKCEHRLFEQVGDKYICRWCDADVTEMAKKLKPVKRERLDEDS